MANGNQNTKSIGLTVSFLKYTNFPLGDFSFFFLWTIKIYFYFGFALSVFLLTLSIMYVGLGVFLKLHNNHSRE